MSKGNVIAYIDDDSDDLEILQEAFVNVDSYTIEGFTDQDAFLSYISTNPHAICMALIDINMPLRSGIDLAYIVSAMPQAENVPVTLYSTSRTLPPNMEKQWNYIAKPVSMNELEDTVSRILEACRRHANQ